jgi:lysophospholipase L1-like esterase
MVAAGSSGMATAGAGGVAGRALAGAGGSAGAPSMPTDISVWIAGDSTVAKGETPCPVGWGADFQSLFNTQVKVANSAVGGRSVRTWLYDVQTTMDSSGECVLGKDASGKPTLQARWQAMLDGMKAGDYLMIQFGINDSSATCDRHVGLAAFKESYGMMAEAAKMRGTQPIFLTPVSSISCQGSTARGTRGGYVTATQEAGQQYGVPVIDLHALSVELYTSLGLCPIPGGSDVSASTGGKVGSFFCDDHTHFERTGADQIGQLIAKALRDQKLGLADYLK